MSFRYLLVVIIFALCLGASAPIDEAAKLLPNKLGNFVATSAARPVGASQSQPENFNVKAAAARDYRAPTGEKIVVTIWQTVSDNCAYALLLNETAGAETMETAVGTFARASASPAALSFFQGPVYVRLTGAKTESLTALGAQLAATLGKGEGDIPSLVKHLPDWEKAQPRALYAVTPNTLKAFTENQPVLTAVSFEGGTEAVVANYGDAQMVIAEFANAALAVANDAAIQAKINELQTAGQPAPSAYKRVGNYGVFVFNAPDAQTAQNLVEQVKYEKTVQWLGENPNRLMRAQKRFVNITTGIFVSVVKASGLAIALALGLGGLIGALVFRRRRAQTEETSLYTDAGGMMRLNLDELTSETNPSRLLENGE